MPDDIPAMLRYPWDTPPAHDDAIEVAPGVLWLRLPLPMKLDHVNVYAFDEGDSWTIIDTGFSSKKAKAIWRDLMAGPLGGKPISRVVVTHHHPDHIGLAGWFQTEFGAELVTTRTAWLTARMLTLDTQEAPAAETLAFYKLSGMDRDLYDKRAAERPFNFADIVDPLPLGFTRIKQGVRLGTARDGDEVGLGRAAPRWGRMLRHQPAAELGRLGDRRREPDGLDVGPQPAQPRQARAPKGGRASTSPVNAARRRHVAQVREEVGRVLAGDQQGQLLGRRQKDVRRFQLLALAAHLARCRRCGSRASPSARSRPPALSRLRAMSVASAFSGET